MSLSKCCKARIKPMGRGEGTRWHMCSKCKLATDPIVKSVATSESKISGVALTRNKVAVTIRKHRAKYFKHQEDLNTLARFRAPVNGFLMNESHALILSLAAKQKMEANIRRLLKQVERK